MFRLYYVLTKCPYVIYKKIILSIHDTDILSIPHIDKIIFVYIAYGQFVFT